MAKRTRQASDDMRQQSRLVGLPTVNVGTDDNPRWIVTGPTAERARQAGEPLIYHRASGEMRRDPKGGMEKLDAGGLRIASDTLTVLHKRQRLSPSDVSANNAMYEAGKRLERIIEVAGLAGALASPNLSGGSQGDSGPKPYVGSERILAARNSLATIRANMPRRDWQAVEWVVVTGFTVEQGGQMIGGAEKSGQAVFLDRLRSALEWLVDHWGMMARRSAVGA